MKIKKHSVVKTLVDLPSQNDVKRILPAGTVAQVSKVYRDGNRKLYLYCNYYGFLAAEHEVELTPGNRQVPKVGDVFLTSWGYDQTNIDFYQITAVKGESVKVRQIRGETVNYANMSGEVRAVKDSFCGEEMTKRLKYSIKGIPSFRIASYANAFPDDGGTHFFSEWH